MHNNDNMFKDLCNVANENLGTEATRSTAGAALVDRTIRGVSSTVDQAYESYTYEHNGF